MSDLDYKEIYILWLELGSLEKVCRNLESRGLLTRGGKKYAPSRINHVVWKYATENPEEALEIYRSLGFEISDEDWERLLVEKAFLIYFKKLSFKSRTAFNKWLTRMGLFEKYKDYGRVKTEGFSFLQE